MAWLARFVPGYDEFFNFVFGPVWMHWVSHALLFAVLSFLLLSLLVPRGWAFSSRVALVLAIVLIVAWLQESIQLWSKGRAWGGDEWFDMMVDVGGALVGVVIWLGFRRRSFFT